MDAGGRLGLLSAIALLKTSCIRRCRGSSRSNSGSVFEYSSVTPVSSQPMIESRRTCVLKYSSSGSITKCARVRMLPCVPRDGVQPVPAK